MNADNQHRVCMLAGGRGEPQFVAFAISMVDFELLRCITEEICSINNSHELVQVVSDTALTNSADAWRFALWSGRPIVGLPLLLSEWTATSTGRAKQVPNHVEKGLERAERNRKPHPHPTSQRFLPFVMFGPGVHHLQKRLNAWEEPCCGPLQVFLPLGWKWLQGLE